MNKSNIICNPLNISYKYMFLKTPGAYSVSREAADPSLVYFRDKYYMFPSMSYGFWVSDNLALWKYVETPELPAYDYAPDIRVIGNYLYFTASNRKKKCKFYRTKDPESGKFEEVSGNFKFFDPNMFCDDDGRVYFYWGCTNNRPIYGIELNPADMTRIGKPIGLINGNKDEHGFERLGEDYILEKPKTFFDKLLRIVLGDAPFIEGAWMTKHKGKYYLQYAAPDTKYNTYADGVYISDHPLGPFTYAKNNPYSYKPGGFIPGAGHGSTLQDKYGNYWHASTMRISVNQNFERRVGLFPAGFDLDGELFCNQRYGDWPMNVPQKAFDPWEEPEWMLLSYGKSATASSYQSGFEPVKVLDENVRTWWKAQTNKRDEWVTLDLQQEYDVRAIQINFADDSLTEPVPQGAKTVSADMSTRYIERKPLKTRWLLEYSSDGENYTVIADKSQVDTDLPHDLVVLKAGVSARFIRLTIIELPFDQKPTVSGIRVFGKGSGQKPQAATNVSGKRINDLEATIHWKATDAMGVNVLFGYLPDKLYHSYMVYGKEQLTIGALNKGQDCYCRVDAFNENGITAGSVFKL